MTRLERVLRAIVADASRPSASRTARRPASVRGSPAGTSRRATCRPGDRSRSCSRPVPPRRRRPPRSLGGTRRSSYAELDDGVQPARPSAHAAASAPGSLWRWCCPARRRRSPLLAVVKTGAAYLPVDPELPADAYRLRARRRAPGRCDRRRRTCGPAAGCAARGGRRRRRPRRPALRPPTGRPGRRRSPDESRM